MKNFLIFFGVLISMSIGAQTLSKEDLKFAKAAAEGGMMEVQLGETAQRNGYTPEIKTCGRRMVEDHSKANDELKDLAKRKGIDLPTSLDEKKKKKCDDLYKLTGKTFDKAYAKFMIKDHKADIAELKKEAKKGSDPDLKAWAADKIPAFESHLQMWEAAYKAAKL